MTDDINTLNLPYDQAMEAFKADGPPFFEGQAIPYVLFWRPVTRWRNNKAHKMNDLTCIHLTGAVASMGGIQVYLNKPGWKLIDYWMPDEPRFLEFRVFLNTMMGRSDERVKELEEANQKLLEEKSAFERKVIEYKKKEEQAKQKQT